MANDERRGCRQPLTNPKNGPNSLVAENPLTYRPDTLISNDALSEGNPFACLMRSISPARYGTREMSTR